MSKIKNFSAKLEMRNVKLRLSISVIFLLLIIPVFIAFILYSYQTNYSIYKKNAIDLVTRANNESIHNLIDFLDPIADAARVTAKLVNSNPELINQDKIADHIIVNLENNPNIVSYFLASCISIASAAAELSNSNIFLGTKVSFFFINPELTSG